MTTNTHPMTEAERLACIDAGRRVGSIVIEARGLVAARELLNVVQLGCPADAAFFLGFAQALDQAAQFDTTA